MKMELMKGRRRFDLPCTIDDVLDLVRTVCSQTDTPKRLCQPNEVRIGAGQIGVTESIVVEELLPLPHHPEVGVIHDHDFERQPVGSGDTELLNVHEEPPVAVDRNDDPVFATNAKGRTNRSGQ